MAAMRLCDACGMEFDWPGVQVKGYDYCCEACARGERCTCEQHHHQYEAEQPLNRAAAEQLGVE
jgi:hypothetical protein